ncbi:TetR/AcrR family transcriptional regulator [Mycolicibacterium litorale]|uniref:TetR/AcrR family transcriptional regulator n=1 Tax=Mycolicibacterium litorale TaxID=758802 RepID=UPI003CE8E63B
MSVRRQPARSRLLRAADELFYGRGIATTGVDAVIEKAGVATGSLYKNFRGKDDLVAAYLADRDRRWRDLWEACIEAETDPEERVLAIFTATELWSAQTSLARGCAHVAAAVQLPHDHPGLAAVAAHKRHAVARLTREVAAAGVADADRTARDIALVYDGMLSALAVGVEPDPVGRARRIARLLLASP